MKKVIKAYCISIIDKSVRKFQQEDPRRLSIDICHACLYKNKKECENLIKKDIESWKKYQSYCPTFKIPEYEIVEVEMKVLNQIKYG